MHTHTYVELFSCVWLCNPMDCSTPGFPVHHYLPEIAQTHVHQVGDAISSAIAPFCLLSFPASESFSNESAVCTWWPKYWSFDFSISLSNEYSGLISFRIDWFDFLAVQGTDSRVFSNATVQKHQFFDAQASLWSNCHIPTWLVENPTHIYFLLNCLIVSFFPLKQGLLYLTTVLQIKVRKTILIKSYHLICKPRSHVTNWSIVSL